MTFNVFVTNGNQEYVGGTLIETTGKDISGDTFKIGLSANSLTPPTSWSTPSVNTAGLTQLVIGGVTIPVTAQRRILLLIAPGATLGAFVAWGQCADGSEIVARVLQTDIQVI